MTLQEALAQALQDAMGIPHDDHSRHDFGDIGGGPLMRPMEAAAAILDALPLFDVISDAFGSLGEYREDEEIQAFVEALRR